MSIWYRVPVPVFSSKTIVSIRIIWVVDSLRIQTQEISRIVDDNDQVDELILRNGLENLSSCT
ncbi:hypothetical protein Hanom_Chr13g01198871 [Helianthus anomalus]